MGISLKTEHLKRYKDLAALFLKYGRSDLMLQTGLDEIIQEEHTDRSGPAELAKDLEKLGPTFIKLGQLLSTRADLFPPACLDELARLQDKCEPFSFQEVERLISEELGLRLSKAFGEFEAEPIAAASLGQVHRATMLDGRMVAVKVQRPGIRKQVLDDLEAMNEITQLLDKHTKIGTRHKFSSMLAEFRKAILRELDYRQEARNLVNLKENLKSFDRILIPSPIDDYTTSIILTMEYVEGKKITTLGPLARIDLEGEILAEQLFSAYLQQILVDGFFHADPHPGNVFLTQDGRIALLDLGMVGYLMPRLQENLLQLLIAIGEGRGEDAAATAIKIGEIQNHFSEPDLSREVCSLVARYQNANMGEIQTGKVVMEISRIASDCGLYLPSELTMLGKTLLNLDQIGIILDPTFDPNASIRRNAAEIMSKKMVKSLSPGNLFTTAIEMKDFLERLPGRVNRLLDAASTNQLKLKVDAIDEERLIEGIQKIANRITMGLILAALIIGASLLMRVQTSFRILGYPGFAIFFFLTAACGGLLLVMNILWHDRQSRK